MPLSHPIADRFTSRVQRAGFTLVELLVVISIVSLLVAILLPTLASARESSRAIRCSANLQQIGIAITNYSYDYRDYLPPVRDIALDDTTWDWALRTYLNIRNASSDPATIGYYCQSEDIPPTNPQIARATRSYGYNSGIGTLTSNGKYSRTFSEFTRAAKTSRLLLAGDMGISTMNNHAVGRRFNSNLTPYKTDEIYRYNNSNNVVETAEATMRHGNGQTMNVLYIDGHVERRGDAYLLRSGCGPVPSAVENLNIWYWNMPN